jgi:hypothetical protein
MTKNISQSIERRKTIQSGDIIMCVENSTLQLIDIFDNY